MSKRSNASSRRLRAQDVSEGSFHCVHCHLQVSSSPFIAGVQNRNHCPYCLWSRHVDMNKTGDRLAGCKAEMQPLGLTLKATRKKYGPARAGELMLIHQCLGCGKISINRIAADDDSSLLLEVFRGSLELDSVVKNELAGTGIVILQTEDEQIVFEQLFGRGSYRMPE
jgi:hypothetical protein